MIARATLGIVWLIATVTAALAQLSETNTAAQNKTELQALIDNAPDGKLVLPAGDFDIESGVEIDRDNFTLAAAYELGTKFNVSGTGAFLHLNPSGTTNGANTKRRIAVEGLDLVDTNTTPTLTAILVTDVSKGHIADVQMAGFDVGINLSTRNNFDLDRNTVQFCKIGLYIPSWFATHVPQQIWLHHLQSYQCEKAISFATYVADVKLHDVVANALGISGAQGIRFSEGADGVEIYGFNTESFAANGIELYLKDVKGNVFGGRLVESNTTGAQIRGSSVVNFYGTLFQQTAANNGTSIDVNSTSFVRLMGVFGAPGNTIVGSGSVNRWP